MSAIPKAQDFVRAQEQKEASVASEEVKWTARLNDAADEMIVALTKLFCNSISSLVASKSLSKRAEVRMARLGIYKGLPGDVLLYGHRVEDNWYKRTQLGMEVTALERLQALFYAEGWFLIEESDPARSKNFVFALYAEKPHARHGFFNQLGRVWHNNNIFNEKKIAQLAEELSTWGPEQQVEEVTLPESTCDLVNEDETYE